MRKLQTYSHVTIVETTAEKPVQLQHGPNDEALLSVDDTTFHFQHLIGADGVKHSSTNMVNHYLNQPLITYKKTSHQDRQLHQAAVQLKVVDDVVGRPGRHKEKPSMMEQLATLKRMGWDKDYFPKSYLFTSQDGRKFSFAGECPDKIAQLADPKEREKALHEFSAYLISLEYDLDPHELIFHNSLKSEKKDVIRANAFLMEGHQTEVSSARLGVKQTFAPIGDARRIPNFYYGHGVNDGIRTGLAFINAIRDDYSFDEKKYDAFVKQVDSDIDTAMASTEKLMTAGSLMYLKHMLEVIDIMESSLVKAQRSGKVVDRQLGALTRLKSAVDGFPGKIDEAYQAMKELDDLVLQQTSPTLSKRCIFALQAMLPKAVLKAFSSVEIVEPETKEQLVELQKSVESYFHRGM